MARDERRRQKALARKKAKKQARRHAQQSRTGAFQDLFDGISKSAIRHAPIHECLCGESLQEHGIGYVVISRTLPNSDLAVGVFLVDTFCLGVKTAVLRIASPGDYDSLRAGIAETMPVSPVTASRARKLVEGAVAYARQLGFEPPRDYHTAALVLEDIDPTECPDELVFGKDGKPFYVRGPGEDAIRADQIVKQLTLRCGPDGFKFLVADPLSEFDEDVVEFDADLDDDGDDQAAPDEVDDLTMEILSTVPPPAPDSPPPAPPEEKPKGLFDRLFRK